MARNQFPWLSVFETFVSIFIKHKVEIKPLTFSNTFEIFYFHNLVKMIRPFLASIFLLSAYVYGVNWMDQLESIYDFPALRQNTRRRWRWQTAKENYFLANIQSLTPSPTDRTRRRAPPCVSRTRTGGTWMWWFPSPSMGMFRLSTPSRRERRPSRVLAKVVTNVIQLSWQFNKYLL